MRSKANGKNGNGESRRLTAAQLELARQEEEIRRKAEEVQARLKVLPAQMKEKEEKRREMMRMQVSTVARGEYLARKQHQPGRGDGEVMPRRRLRMQQRQGKIKFLILCMIFVVLFFLLLRVMPA
jgi:hypothetical protein